MSAPIAILTPSRDRTEQLREMIDETLWTAHGEVAIYIGLDDDDQGDYRHLEREHVHVIRAPRMQLGPWTNHLAALTCSQHPILASFGDDHRPRTPGWDIAVRDAFERHGRGLVYSADGLQDERLPTAPFWSAEVIAALGWYFPPAQKHLFADDFWLHLATLLHRRVYLPGVLIEHLHPSCGKASADAITEANDSHYDADGAAYQAYIASPAFARDLERARSAL